MHRRSARVEVGRGPCPGRHQCRGPSRLVASGADGGAELAAEVYRVRPDAKLLAFWLGDVVLAPFVPTAFLDPADTGELRLLARHGSLTPEEMLIPLLSWPSA